MAARCASRLVGAPRWRDACRPAWAPASSASCAPLGRRASSPPTASCSSRKGVVRRAGGTTTTTTTSPPLTEVTPDALHEQSLEACGWYELCEHLSDHASTRLGQEACRSLTLPAGGSWESEALLDETHAAVCMECFHGVSLDFGGVMSAEVRRALYKAEKFAPLGGDELAAMTAFIGAAGRLAKTIEGVRENGAPPPELHPLRLIASAMVSHPEVADKIRACVDDQGEFKDGASPELRRARSQRGAAEGKLRRALQSHGSGTVTTHQGRLVLAVPPPAPADALVVGVAAGGALVLVEPPSVVTLNGELARACAAEETAIDAIRRTLTYAVAEVVVDLFQCLDLVTRLDVIAAKGRHAVTLNACRPTFVLPPSAPVAIPPFGVNQGAEEEVTADAAQAAADAAMFPTLGPNGGRIDAQKNDDDDDDDDDDVDGGYGEDDGEERELLVELAGLRQPILAAQAIRAQAAARRKAAAKSSRKKKRAGGREDDDEYEEELLLGRRQGRDGGVAREGSVHTIRGPVPVDVFVPLNTRCVVITGPNTGGKTAVMKAVGLAALMSRAGLFVPAEVAKIPWFDAVLVDIGDSQDLMQSLSTFSARLAKQRAILTAVNPQSLVLMDEVGTGTSPAEGSAIGGALLEQLAGVGDDGTLKSAGLTLATTHHGELKALKYEHPGGVFENAAVEFDEVALAPTYRLLWGVPGRSRALQIAERFGLEPGVVADARATLGEGRATLEETISALETARRDADEDIAAAQLLLREVSRTLPRIASAEARVSAAEDGADVALASGVAKLARDRRAALAAKERDASRVAAQERRASTLKTGAVDFATSAAAAAAAEVEAKRAAARAERMPAGKPPAGWVPEVGENVRVISTGMTGKVTAVISDDLVAVQAGLMTIKVNASDTEPNVSAHPPKPRVAKARSPKGSQAARRMDALLGSHRSGGLTGGGKKPKSPPAMSTRNLGYDFDDDDDEPTIGDTVRIRKSGVVGTIVDVDGGVLTVQAGRNRLKAPVGGVEYPDRPSRAPAAVTMTAGEEGAGAKIQSKGKKKKKGKGGSGLPRATQQSFEKQMPSSQGSGSGGSDDINALMEKFRRK